MGNQGEQQWTQDTALRGAVLREMTSEVLFRTDWDLLVRKSSSQTGCWNPVVYFAYQMLWDDGVKSWWEVHKQHSHMCIPLLQISPSSLSLGVAMGVVESCLIFAPFFSEVLLQSKLFRSLLLFFDAAVPVSSTDSSCCSWLGSLGRWTVSTFRRSSLLTSSSIVTNIFLNLGSKIVLIISVFKVFFTIVLHFPCQCTVTFLFFQASS